jgi:hypothetical protein
VFPSKLNFSTIIVIDTSGGSSIFSGVRLGEGNNCSGVGNWGGSSGSGWGRSGNDGIVLGTSGKFTGKTGERVSARVAQG